MLKMHKDQMNNPERGRYMENKEYVTFMADTAANSNDVNLVLNTISKIYFSSIYYCFLNH